MSRNLWTALGTLAGIGGVVGGSLLWSRRASAAEGRPSSGAPTSPSDPPVIDLPPLPRAQDVRGDLTTNWGTTPVDLRPLFVLMEEVSKIAGSARFFSVVAYGEARYSTTAHNGDATGERPVAAIGVVVATAVVVVACRVWVATQAVMPKGPDVIGPWAVASHLSRAPVSIDMYDLPPYSVGMGAVLAPFVRVVDDPATRYRLVVALLGLSSLFAGWCIATVVRRAWDATPLQRAVAFCVTSAITAGRPANAPPSNSHPGGNARGPAHCKEDDSRAGRRPRRRR